MRQLIILFTSLALAPAGILDAGNERKPLRTSDDPVAVIETLKLGSKLETDDDGRVKTLTLIKATDRGLLHLRGLKQLKSLTVYKTQVTYEGIAKRKQAVPEVVVVPQKQVFEGVHLELLGVRHHPKRKSLLIRVEYWGKNVASVKIGNPVISVDGQRRRAWAPG